ncbi:MAG: hypothetical protein P8185_23485 [Deltaproteobacteria bacterium]
MHRVDVVQRILGKAAIGGKAIGAVASFEIAVIQAGGIVSDPAVQAASAAQAGFDRDPIPD